ncbi:phosphate acetyltransferase [Tunicatimonas pelagia]|uniref:phosphate acetyltransferase n=1 Tax=Tunicatimonas pelagia TaxID=931531 RepID=UPI002665B191|nr:phosphate acetyltransferase [Tunicatimonas pelagia]WKN43329.1 phosphate acetyltransferase [Tunicatimonas pelagia]
MASSLYVTTTEAHTGKSLVCLGMLEMILRKTERVGIFRPLISGNSGQQDKNIHLLLEHFQLKQSYEESYGYHRREARELILEGKYDQVLDRVIEKFKALEQKYDFVLCEGSDFTDENATLDFNINVDFAKNLGCPVLLLARGDQSSSIEDILSPVQITYDSFVENECEVVSVIINRTQPDLAHELLLSLRNRISKKETVLGVIPGNATLQSPTLGEIKNHLQAQVLYGGEQLDRQAYRYSVAATQLQHYLPYLTDQCLVITPGDRADIILSVLQAHQSKNYPDIAGILLTTKFTPEESISRVLDGITDIVPILSVEENTYNTVAQIGKITSSITPENETKILLSKRLFEKYIDTTVLQEKVSNVQQRGMTPRMFQYNLVKRAKSEKKHIVLPEGDDERVLRAAEILLEQNIVNLTILGNVEAIKNNIGKLGLRIDTEHVSIIDPAKTPQAEKFAERFVELRQHKGANLDMARDTVVDVSYFGTMMVLEGLADGMVSGAAHTTQHTIRPALQLIKTKPNVSLVSSVFFMALPDRVLVYGDCAINPNPNAEELAEIAISSAQTSEAFGIEPKIAMLSYSSGASGQGEDVDRVRQATEIVKERMTDLKIEGPIQYDAAVDKEVGIKKIPGSEVAGYATVLIFPDLNTGNNTYKAVQRETGAVAIGPILQGLRKPVNDLSRGCTVTDIVNTVVITAIQAQNITE